jgi:hypothetical protein
VKRYPDDPSVRYLPSVLQEPASGYRFMKRRRHDRRENTPSPLSGMGLLFPVGLAFALAFMLAAFAGFGISELLVADTFTMVTNPGGTNMTVVVKRNGLITKVGINDTTSAQGVGTLVGSFYRLADGSVIWQPAPAPGTVQPTPPAPPVSPTPGYTPYETTTTPYETTSTPYETTTTPGSSITTPPPPMYTPGTPTYTPPQTGQGGHVLVPGNRS